MKDYFGDKWIKAYEHPSTYPLGTKFKALMGGYWTRVKNGFKWCTGATFSNIGGDWTGEVCLPKNQISISEIKQLKARLREINSMAIEDIDFLDEKGTPVPIDVKILEDWKFTGLNNTDFIDSDFYIQGFTEDDGSY